MNFTQDHGANCNLDTWTIHWPERADNKLHDKFCNTAHNFATNKNDINKSSCVIYQRWLSYKVNQCYSTRSCQGHFKVIHMSQTEKKTYPQIFHVPSIMTYTELTLTWIQFDDEWWQMFLHQNTFPLLHISWNSPCFGFYMLQYLPQLYTFISKLRYFPAITIKHNNLLTPGPLPLEGDVGEWPNTHPEKKLHIFG